MKFLLKPFALCALIIAFPLMASASSYSFCENMFNKAIHADVDTSIYSAHTQQHARRKLRARAKRKCEERNVDNINQCVRNILQRRDPDKDGIAKRRDNCLEDENFEQNDNDNDTLGDVCDNCPVNANVDQADTDADGVGNACDADNAQPSV